VNKRKQDKEMKQKYKGIEGLRVEGKTIIVQDYMLSIYNLN